MRLTGDRLAIFDRLPAADRDRFSLMTGKMSSGTPLTGHQHAYFALYPDEFGLPTRLIVFRREAFKPEEVEALMAGLKKLFPGNLKGRTGNYASFHFRSPFRLR